MRNKISNDIHRTFKNDDIFILENKEELLFSLTRILNAYVAYLVTVVGLFFILF